MTFIIAILGSGLSVAELYLQIGIPLTLQLASAFGAGLVILGMIELRCGTMFAFLDPAGNITYSSYLLHSPLQMTLLMAGSFGLFAPELLLTNGFAVCYIVLLVMLSVMAYRWVERPAQSAIRRYALPRRQVS